MSTYDEHDDVAEDRDDAGEPPEGTSQWAVLGENGTFVAEGQSFDTYRAWATMTAVMKLQPEGERVHGLLRDHDTDRVARFERVKPGWYREVRNY